MGDTISDKLQVKFGLVQGSVLSSCFFTILYTYDLIFVYHRIYKIISLIYFLLILLLGQKKELS